MKKIFMAQPDCVNNFFPKAFVTLSAVLVMGTVGLAVAITLMLLGLGFSQTSFAIEQQSQAKALADACAERGLETVRDNNGFSGTINLNLGQGTCNYTVIILSGENREIRASASISSVIRKVKINIDQINPVIKVFSWQEVADW